MISAIGLVGGLALLIFLTIRGVNILIAAPLCAAIVAATSGVAWMPPLAGEGAPDFVTSYMAGFTGFFADWFFMFLLGAIFGEVMAVSGAADSVARWVVKTFGIRRAAAAVVAACAVLTYGGVSVFIVAFSVYPMAVSLFREADLPRRFIPGALAFGSVTFTMTSAGSPEIQNLIPMQYLGTTAYAAWETSLVVAIFMAAFGFVWLSRMIRRATAKGERFEPRANDRPPRDVRDLPNPLVSLAPLVAVLGVFLLLQYPEYAPDFLGFAMPEASLGKYALIGALGAGAFVAALIGLKQFAQIPAAFSTGATGAVVAITNTCAVVGFGAIAKLSPAFQEALVFVQSLPGDPLIGAAIAVTVIAGLTGSASGGQTIALPLIAPHYLDAGVNPNELHRVVAISSGALDSLPHNGYVVTTIRAICGETHKAAYGAVWALTVITPLIGLVMAIAIFIIF
ncbi:GntP family permease [Amphiplicatus metriothermophilus]|uniref:H+/gluconate symporter n=1 Tax=Amphiplicatus metriothermophilus TaxID=1519374 RepID=A0A239PR84_9PROT|nr:GntP family permease [Amphiplicatus metriothermophilus]MBB5518442.1 H+/gluconate symporter-like permease [Amphiplicatus metriothermophilus]SNT72396.1 H+/gluconate symporter [Amphiplicatus metriothermophilus]